jgi:hypothetical protein
MPETSLDDFRAWLVSRNSRPYFLGPQRFEKLSSGQVVVDRGVFELEEAQEIGVMLLSRNPISRLAAEVGIWEKNGSLLKAVLIGAAILGLIAVFIFTH